MGRGGGADLPVLPLPTLLRTGRGGEGEGEENAADSQEWARGGHDETASLLVRKRHLHFRSRALWEVTPLPGTYCPAQDA